MKNKSKNYTIIFLSVTLVFITIYICYKLFPLLISLKDPIKQEAFKNTIKNMGWKGYIAFLIIQILQIFVAFIPGEIIEILSGILYGALGGLFICLLGILIGSILIFYTIKLFAYKKLHVFKEKLKTYSFLNNQKKIHIYLFMIFLIPGTPKDIFIYFVPFLPIKFSSFLLLSLIARIPSIISSTIVGDSIVQGNYSLSIILFSIFAIIGTTSILFKDKLINLFKKSHKELINNTNNNLEN